MSAFDALQSTSEAFDLKWNDNSMLAIACQYIDNNCPHDDFFKFVVEQATFETQEIIEEEYGGNQQ